MTSDKIGFLSSCDCVFTTIWMHHMDTNKIHGQKTRCVLHKNATCCFEQILKQHPTKQQLCGHLPPISKNI